MTKREQTLLVKINTPFAPKKKQHFNLLIAKRDTKTLSSTEYEELLELTEAFEKYELCRLKLLANKRRFKNPAKEGRIIVFYSLS